MASPEARERFARKNEADDLKRAFEFLDRRKDGVIDEEDLSQVFTSLGHKTRKGEIADMIWEVDEDCDSAIDWKVRPVIAVCAEEEM
jgi:calmodulin